MRLGSHRTIRHGGQIGESFQRTAGGGKQRDTIEGTVCLSRDAAIQGVADSCPAGRAADGHRQWLAARHADCRSDALNAVGSRPDIAINHPRLVGDGVQCSVDADGHRTAIHDPIGFTGSGTIRGVAEGRTAGGRGDRHGDRSAINTGYQAEGGSHTLRRHERQLHGMVGGDVGQGEDCSADLRDRAIHRTRYSPYSRYSPWR